PEDPIPPAARVIHADVNTAEIGKNRPVEIALPGDLKCTLSELISRIRPRLQRMIAEDAPDQQRHDLLKKVDAERARRPMSPLVLMHAISQSVPENIAVVEEATTTTQGFL